MTPSTPSIGHIFALQSKLNEIFEEGIAARLDRHAKTNALVHDWVRRRGFDFFAEEGFRSKTLTCVKNSRGIDVLAMANKLREKHHLVIDPGYGKLKGQTFPPLQYGRRDRRNDLAFARLPRRLFAEALDPAPDPAFVAEIFLSEFALEISFFARDDKAIDEDEADWHGEQHPSGIDQDRQPKRRQSEPEIHRIASKAIKSVRDDARARIEWNGISAGAFLRNKSADGQCNSSGEDQGARYPSERALREGGRDKPFERERRGDRQDEQKRRRDRNTGMIFFR